MGRRRRGGRHAGPSGCRTRRRAYSCHRPSPQYAIRSNVCSIEWLGISVVHSPHRRRCLAAQGTLRLHAMPRMPRVPSSGSAVSRPARSSASPRSPSPGSSPTVSFPKAVKYQHHGLDRGHVERLSLERYKPGRPYWITEREAPQTLGISRARVFQLRRADRLPRRRAQRAALLPANADRGSAQRPRCAFSAR